MVNTSQSNLLNLAKQEIEKGNLDEAIQHLLEALRLGHSTEIVCKLCELFLKKNNAKNAYVLIKEEPDLFSDTKVYELYLKILQALNYNIEALELENLSGKKLDIKISPVSEEKQHDIIRNFRTLKAISEDNYLELYKLSEEHFIQLAQSLLIDSTQSFALRLSLCEDLIKLGYDKKVVVSVMGESKSFIPAETMLLQKDPIYRECCVSLADYLKREPSKLPMMVGELNVCLGMLYPKLHDYISDPDQFTHDFRKYLESKQGGANQKLLDKIYQYLAYEKAIK